MSNVPPDIEDIRIEHPERWCLDLSVNTHQLQFILYAPEQSESLVMRSIALDKGVPALQALENAVYDHPLLLGDYRRVRVVTYSPHFLVLPTPVAGDDTLVARSLAEAYPADDGERATCTLPQCGVSIAYLLPQGTMGFLQRTFNNPPVVHHLYPLCEHFKSLNQGSRIARMFVNLQPGRMDMAVYRQGEFILANSLAMRNTADATYLLLHTWQSMGLDALTDEIQLTGDKSQRDELAPELRRFVKYVMPAIFPASALRLGQDAMQAPLDLILLATCES